MDDKKNCEIVKHIAVLSYRGAWRKEVNLIKWFGNEAKYDIRDWNESHTEMSKGVTLTSSESTIDSLLMFFHISSWDSGRQI